MKVFYTSPWRGRDDYQHLYDKVVKSLQRHKDVEVVSLEVMKYEDILSADKVKSLNGDELHYEYLKKAISMSDAAVLEASFDSFKIGHETTLGLMYGKPVLCLSTKADYSNYIKHPLFFPKHYSGKEELDGIVDTFLNDVRNKHLTIRMNSLISPDQSRFLDWCSKRTNRSKSEIIRNLVNDYRAEFPEFDEENLKPFN
jgi:hypothetical protein